jgi:hypothetical protein
MANTKASTEEKAQEVVRTEGERPQRKQRVPFGIPRAKLSVAVPIAGYHLHWINDAPGRIQGALDGGYEFVSPSEVGAESSESQVKIFAGTNEDGSPMMAYLMKIKNEWREEDKITQRRMDDQIEAAIKGGKLDERAEDKRYIPSAGISIKRE